MLNDSTKFSYRIEEIASANSDLRSEEIIAVIAAAVAASLDSSVTKLIVRSIKPIPTLTPVWNRAARYDLTRVIL
jgi:hypothetical protein